QPIDDAFVGVPRATDQSVLATVDAFYLELLAGLDPILLTQFRGEHDLALRGNGRFHTCKILVLHDRCQSSRRRPLHALVTRPASYKLIRHRPDPDSRSVRSADTRGE